MLRNDASGNSAGQADSTGDFATEGLPAGHLLQGAANGSIVEQEKQQQKETGVEHPTIDLFDAYCHYPGDEAFHVCAQVKGGAGECHAVEVHPVARKVVGDIVGQAMRVEGIPGRRQVGRSGKKACQATG